jgi:hypothetical protein
MQIVLLDKRGSQVTNSSLADLHIDPSEDVLVFEGKSYQLVGPVEDTLADDLVHYKEIDPDEQEDIGE